MSGAAAEAAGRPDRAAVRRRALGPYLDRVREFCEDPVESARVDPWVRDRILRAAPADDSAGELLAQGIALQMKIALDSRALEAGEGGADREKLYAAQAELMLDTAMGMAISRELQHVVDRSVQAGNLDEAKRLSRYHHGLRHGMSQVQRKIERSELSRATDLSDSLTDRPREQAPADDEMDRLARDVALQVDRKDAEKRLHLRALQKLTRLPARTDVLMVLLGLTAVAWLFVVRMPQQIVAAPPRPIALAELPGNAFAGVTARPPSLFVQVDDAAWSALREREQRALIDRVGVVLLTTGYSGARFTASDGRTVGQWLIDRGGEVVDSGPAAVEGDPAPDYSALTRVPSRPPSSSGP